MKKKSPTAPTGADAPESSPLEEQIKSAMYAYYQYLAPLELLVAIQSNRSIGYAPKKGGNA